MAAAIAPSAHTGAPSSLAIGWNSVKTSAAATSTAAKSSMIDHSSRWPATRRAALTPMRRNGSRSPRAGGSVKRRARGAASSARPPDSTIGRASDVTSASSAPAIAVAAFAPQAIALRRPARLVNSSPRPRPASESNSIASSAPDISERPTPKIANASSSGAKPDASPKITRPAAMSRPEATSEGRRPQRSATMPVGTSATTVTAANADSKSSTWPSVRPRSSSR